MFALTATRRSGGVRRLLLLTTAVRHASALTAVVALRAQSNLLPVRHRALRCAPALLAWEPPPGFKEWKEGDVPFDEEEDDRSFDMFDLVSDGPERRPGSQRRASSPEEFVEALLDAGATGATTRGHDTTSKILALRHRTWPPYQRRTRAYFRTWWVAWLDGWLHRAAGRGGVWTGPRAGRN